MAPLRPKGERLEPPGLTRAFYTLDKAAFENHGSRLSPPDPHRCPQPRTAQQRTRAGPAPFVCFEAGYLAPAGFAV